MTIRQVDEKGVVIQQEDKPFTDKPKPPDYASKDQIAFKAVTQAMDLDNKEISKYKDNINTILQWARLKIDDKNSPEQIKWAIRNLESSLGSPPLSEKRIAQVARYAYLHLEGLKIEAEKQSLMENKNA